MPSGSWAASRPGTSVTTTSSPRCPRSASAARGWSRRGGWLSGRTTASTPSTRRPGVEGAHEKGGVEHEGGRFRRSHLVPVPEVDTLAELNEKIEQIEIAEDVRHIDNRPTSVGFDFDYEAPLPAPLPFEDFDIGLTLTPKVDKTSRITVRQNKYSVLARFIGTNVRVSLRADEVWVFDRNKIVVRHPRLAGRYGFRDLLDHYLEILRHKPGALEHSTGLAAARESGQFTDTHDAFWAAAIESRGRSEGSRALIEVLLLHRRLPDEAVAAGMKAVLEAGSVSPDLVAIEGRKAVAAAGGPPPVVIVPQATVAAEPDTAGNGTGSRFRAGHHVAAAASCPAAGFPARTIAGRLRPVALYPTERLSMTQSTTSAPATTGRWGSFGLPGQRGATPSDTIDAACRTLGLSGVRSRWEEFASQALREHASYADFLAGLLESECEDRDARRKVRRVKEANFPRQKRIEDFDFSKNPNIPQEVINTLTQPGWVQV